MPLGCAGGESGSPEWLQIDRGARRLIRGVRRLIQPRGIKAHATTSTNMAIGAILPKQGEAIQRAAEKVMQGKLMPF